MISRAVLLYGKEDLRIESIHLPELKSGELLLAVKSSAICTSCYKVASLGEEHHRVPEGLNTTPIILGHEFSAEIVKVGDGVSDQFSQGDSCIVQPMVYDELGETLAVGHSFPTLGGYATYIVVPEMVVSSGAIIPWKGEGYYKAALAEPLACIIAAWRSQYHTLPESFKPVHGAKPGGETLLLGGSGSMGFLTALLWQIRSDENSKLTIVGRDKEKLQRLSSFFKKDKRVSVLSANKYRVSDLMESSDNQGFDDIVVFASSKELVQMGLSLLAYDGCLNMFAGPFDEKFEVPVNFHAVHYKRHHIVGSSGASKEDFRTAIALLAENKVDPTFLVTHIGGINAVPETVCRLPEIGGGKKLIYPHVDFPLTELSSFRELAKNDERFALVAKAVENANGHWSYEAENALLKIGNNNINK